MRTLRSCLWALWVALIAPALQAQPLLLDDRSARVELWPAVTVLADAGREMSLDDVRAAAHRFAPPTQAYGTLGLRKEAMWLHMPLAVSTASDGRWILDINYAVLNRVDVHVVVDGRVRQQAVLGNLQPFAQRPLASRSHAVLLELPPGGTAELYLRVETKGGTILPITLNKPASFHARALDEQMLQGLLTGLGGCLLLYSLMQWWSLRETLFLKYAMLTTGSLMFSIYQFGIGAMYLWTDNQWIELHAGGLSALVASAGTALFVEHALAGAHAYAWFSRLMKGVAAVLLLVAVAYAFDLLHVHQVSTVVGTLGLAPAVLGMPGAIARARRGDQVGWYFLAAWTGYFVTTAVMVGLIKGHVDASPWTLHSFQIGATLDMILFMRVIGLRMRAVHTAAQHATRERDTLHSMAHTDPLTGLPNRRGLNASLAQALPHCAPDKLLAVYMLDLDGFKEVNDRHGHDIGDELLVAVTRRLKASLRPTDVVARLGGDEFVVTVAELRNEQQAHDVGLHLLAAFAAPFELPGRQGCSVGVTIGYALVPLDGLDPVGLLKRADAAMYAGKQGGKHCVRRAEDVLPVV